MVTHTYTVAVGSATAGEAAAKSRILALVVLALNSAGWRRLEQVKWH